MEEKNEKDLQKQMISDLEHLIKNDLGSLLALNQEGSQKQIEAAREKIRGDLLKYAPEMKKMAAKMGGPFEGAVDAFLKSIDGILGSLSSLDPAKINEHFNATQKLEKKLDPHKHKKV